MADQKSVFPTGQVVPPVPQSLVEVNEAMASAMEVFSRIKTEKMQSEPPLDISSDPTLQGVPKEIFDKAQKQKGRERANRASAAASRNKVMRYQTELESRLNRVEAERNALRAQLASQLSSSDLALARNFLLKLRSTVPGPVGEVVPLHTLDAFLGATERSVAGAEALGMSVTGATATPPAIPAPQATQLGMALPTPPVGVSAEDIVLAAQTRNENEATAVAVATAAEAVNAPVMGGTDTVISEPSEQEQKMQVDAAMAAAGNDVDGVTNEDEMAPAPKKTRRA